MANFVGRWEDTGDKENFEEFATAMGKKISLSRVKWLFTDKLYKRPYKLIQVFSLSPTLLKVTAERV